MSFTFNGINSETLGLFVEKYPERPFPSRKQSSYDIHGRSGNLIVDENAYTNVTQTYEVYILGGTTGFQQRASQIAHWLLSVVGYANLTDSYDSTVFRKARFTGGVSFLNSLNKFGKATISFDCCPQRYSTEKLTGNLGSTFTIPNSNALMDGLPLITLSNWSTTNRGSITTPTMQISIPQLLTPQSKIYIDFEKQSIYNGSGTILTDITTTGTWDAVGDGDQIVTVQIGTGTTVPVAVEPRRWCV